MGVEGCTSQIPISFLLLLLLLINALLFRFVFIFLHVPSILLMPHHALAFSSQFTTRYEITQNLVSPLPLLPSLHLADLHSALALASHLRNILNKQVSLKIVYTHVDYILG